MASRGVTRAAALLRSSRVSAVAAATARPISGRMISSSSSSKGPCHIPPAMLRVAKTNQTTDVRLQHPPLPSKNRLLPIRPSHSMQRQHSHCTPMARISCNLCQSSSSSSPYSRTSSRCTSARRASSLCSLSCGTMLSASSRVLWTSLRLTFLTRTSASRWCTTCSASSTRDGSV